MPQPPKPIKRHPALFPISREHHHMLVLAQLLKSGVPTYRGLPDSIEGKVAYTKAMWAETVAAHLELEETVLWAEICGRTEKIDALLSELQEEHDQIRYKIDKLSPQTTAAQLDELGVLLQWHIRKEERQLFMLVQQELTEEELMHLGELLGAE